MIMNFNIIIALLGAASILWGTTPVSAQCGGHQYGVFNTVYSGEQLGGTECVNGQSILHDTHRNIRTRSCPSCGGVFMPSTAAYAANNAIEYTNATNDLDWNQQDANYNDFKYALDAHWGATATLDYFREQHCHDSYDNMGSELLVYLIPNPTASNNNAAWLSDDIMYIEEGAGSIVNPLASLDYIAHEFGHGVIKYAIPGGLLYNTPIGVNQETLAISEGLADIWGICVKNYVINNNTVYHKPISAPLWIFGTGPHGSAGSRRADVLYNPYSIPLSGGTAHGNGTILTHWFYLLTNGDNSANFPNPTDLDQSIKDGADIVYRAMTQYMVTGTKFMDLREMTYLAALDLYPPDCPIIERLLNAWDAVGVDEFSAYSKFLLSDRNRYSAFRRVNYTFSGDQDAVVNQLLTSLQLHNLALPAVRNVKHLEFIGLTSITNSYGWPSGSGLWEVGTSFPLAFTTAGHITLSSANNESVLVKAGADCLFRVKSCGVTPPDIIPSRCPGNFPALPLVASPQGEQSSQLELTQIGQPFSIYPNPSSGRITIDWEVELEEPARIEIYDLKGQLIRSEENVTATQVEYDLSQYPAGVYLVKLTTKEQTYTRKAILSH